MTDDRYKITPSDGEPVRIGSWPTDPSIEPGAAFVGSDFAEGGPGTVFPGSRHASEFVVLADPDSFASFHVEKDDRYLPGEVTVTVEDDGDPFQSNKVRVKVSGLHDDVQRAINTWVTTHRPLFEDLENHPLIRPTPQPVEKSAVDKPVWEASERGPMAFKGPLIDRTSIPPDRRPEGSTNDALHKLPVRRTTVHDLRGTLLLLPRTGIIAMPETMHVGGWNCVVIDGGDTDYRRDGYDIWVSDWELQRAVEFSMKTEWSVSYPGSTIRADAPLVFGLDGSKETAEQRLEGIEGAALVSRPVLVGMWS